MIALDELDYELPPELVAQSPAEPRDAARLLVLERAGGALEELPFAALAERARPEDLFVVNDTRVQAAKLRGRKSSGGRVEILLLERLGEERWLALVRAAGLRSGARLRFGELEAEVVRDAAEGCYELCFRAPAGRSAAALLEELGEAPLPPYIRRPRPRKEDLEDYQSIFARVPGAVAAPTASLHFTPELAARMRIASVTLHVGPATFRPIRGAPAEHRLDAERFCVPEETARAIAQTRARGGRVVAVGTTAVRALETTGGEAGEGRTELYILPGHRFRAVDALVTNFHLPRSTLLALVMAFAGVEPVRRAYAFAIERRFRFYSYGDAMWIR